MNRVARKFIPENFRRNIFKQIIKMKRSKFTSRPGINFDENYNIQRRSVNKYLEKIIQEQYETYIKILTDFLEIKDFIHTTSRDNSAEESLEPYWSNRWFPPLDALSLVALIKSRRPDIYFEIGSGNSTKFAKKAIDFFELNTEIYSVDPCPRAEIDLLCNKVFRTTLESLELSNMNILTSNSILFVDNSHRSFQNSDVTVFFTEILPMLPNGLLYGVHDMFLPYDYIQEWGLRYYNEQYLLATYILGGANNDKILLPNYLISQDEKLFRYIEQLWEISNIKSLSTLGGCFWMEKG